MIELASADIAIARDRMLAGFSLDRVQSAIAAIEQATKPIEGLNVADMGIILSTFLTHVVTNSMSTVEPGERAFPDQESRKTFIDAVAFHALISSERPPEPLPEEPAAAGIGILTADAYVVRAGETFPE